MSIKALCLLAFGAIALNIHGASSPVASPSLLAGGTLLAAIEWFDGNVENLTWPSDDSTSLEGVGGEWSNNGAALKDGATYDDAQDCLLDTSADFAFDPTTAMSADLNTITINAEIMFEAYESDGSSYPTVPTNSKGALSVFMFEEGNETNFYFYGLAKLGTTNGWVRLTGGDAKAAASGPTEVSICLTYDYDGNIVVGYAVGDTVLTYNGEEEILFVSDGLPNRNVASVALKNAVEVDSVDGSYSAINLDPTIAFGDVQQNAGYDFVGNTLTFTNLVTAARNLGEITCYVTYGGKVYSATKSAGSGDTWTITLEGDDFKAGNVAAGLCIDMYYHPYGSSEGLLVTNTLGKVTIFQGEEGYETVKWIASKVNGSAVVSTNGTWDVTPEVTDGMMVFEDESAFTAKSAATNGWCVSAETVIKFTEPNDLKVSFDDLDSVPHGAFTLVQTAGTDPDDAGAQFRFAFYGADGWVTNTEYVAGLSTQYTVKVVFDYNAGTATFNVSNNVNASTFTNLVSVPVDVVGVDLMTSIGFQGAGLVESFTADLLKPVADASLVEAGGGRYANIDAALEAGKDDLKLLWDQNWEPGECRAKIDKNGYILNITGAANKEEVDSGYTYYSFGSEYVAQVGDKQYISLAAAFDQADYTDGIAVLLKNLSRTVTVSVSDSCVFDLNNYSISSNADSSTVLNISSGTLVITNSAQKLDVEDGDVTKAGGTGAKVLGKVQVSGGSLQIWGGYFNEKLEDAWIPGELQSQEYTIDGVTYYSVVIVLGDPLFILTDDKGEVGTPHTIEQAETWLSQHTVDPTNIVLIVGLTEVVSNGVDVLFASNFKNPENMPLVETNLDAYLVFAADGFVISNTTDDCKYIFVEKKVDGDVTNLVANVTTKDEYAYKDLTIGGVAITKLMGDTMPLSGYVEITDAFIAPNTTVEEVKKDLLKARPQGDGSNGLSLFANWVLGIPVEGTTKGTNDIYDDHDGQPLMAITSNGDELDVEECHGFIALPFGRFGSKWNVDCDDASDRAEEFGFALNVRPYNVTKGKYSVSGPDFKGGTESSYYEVYTVEDVVNEDCCIYIPEGDDEYRVDLLIENGGE